MDKLKRSTRRNIQTVTGVIIFFTLFGILGKAGIIGYKLSGLLIPLGIYMMLAVSLNLVVGVRKRFESLQNTCTELKFSLYMADRILPDRSKR